MKEETTHNPSDQQQVATGLWYSLWNRVYGCGKCIGICAQSVTFLLSNRIFIMSTRLAERDIARSAQGQDFLRMINWMYGLSKQLKMTQIHQYRQVFNNHGNALYQDQSVQCNSHHLLTGHDRFCNSIVTHFNIKQCPLDIGLWTICGSKQK